MIGKNHSNAEDAEVCQGLRVELRALSAALAQSEAVSKSRGEDLEQAKGDLKGVRAELKKTGRYLGSGPGHERQPRHGAGAGQARLERGTRRAEGSK